MNFITRVVMESDLQKSVLASLDGRDTEIYPYLPYLLQDMWELGSMPRDIINLIRKHNLSLDQSSTILDLGCGKGAVAINLVREFSCHIIGIDGMPEFIAEAKQFARQYKVETLCTFQVGDIREEVKKKYGCNLALLGSIGPVFGDIETTITSVRPCLKTSGYLIIDDGYLKDNSELQKEHYDKRGEILKQIERCPVQIVDEYYIDESTLGDLSDEMYAQIQNRVAELIEKYPQQQRLFENYLKVQEQEFSNLENDIQGVTWLLQYKD